MEKSRELEKSREVKVFDESQEMEPQISQTNPLAPKKDGGMSPIDLRKQKSSKSTNQRQVQTPRDKQSTQNANEPTDAASDSFNTSILNDMGNMSMVSFNMESTSALGLGDMGGMMVDSVNGINLMQIKDTLQARENKIKQLVADKQKLKALMTKAKNTINTINQ